MKEQTRVLIMDEDCGVRNVLTQILRNSEFLTSTTNDASEAYKEILEAEKGNKHFAVVIADLTINHSRKEGALTLLKKLDGNFLETKIIVSSGWTLDAEMIKPKEFGFVASLEKPLNREMIIGTINKAILAPTVIKKITA